MTEAPFLRGESVSLQPVDEDAHTNFLQRLWNDEGVRSADAGIDSRPFTTKHVENMFSDLIASDAISLVVTVEERPIGLVDLRDIDEAEGTAVLGADVLSEEQGNGYGSDAVRALLSYAFANVDIHKVIAKTVEPNESAMRTLESLGFECEGVLREEAFVDGERHGLVYYGLLREEWTDE